MKPVKHLLLSILILSPSLSALQAKTYHDKEYDFFISFPQTWKWEAAESADRSQQQRLFATDIDGRKGFMAFAFQLKDDEFALHVLVPGIEQSEPFSQLLQTNVEQDVVSRYGKIILEKKYVGTTNSGASTITFVEYIQEKDICYMLMYLGVGENDTWVGEINFTLTTPGLSRRNKKSRNEPTATDTIANQQSESEQDNRQALSSSHAAEPAKRAVTPFYKRGWFWAVLAFLASILSFNGVRWASTYGAYEDEPLWLRGALVPIQLIKNLRQTARDRASIRKHTKELAQLKTYIPWEKQVEKQVEEFWSNHLS